MISRPLSIVKKMNGGGVCGVQTMPLDHAERKKELDEACILGTKLRTREICEKSWFDGAGMQSRGLVTLSEGP